MTQSEFASRVNELVKGIPKGRVMTYGQIASLAGNARASRIVGGIAHFGDPEIPWQRIVNKKGGLAHGYPGGMLGHKKDLEADGVECIKKDGEYRVDIDALLWLPMESTQDKIAYKKTLPRVLFIVGPTASGKTALAIDIAKTLHAEIICADSQTLRRELNIGTAKPTFEEMDGVVHHMLDVIDPYEPYSLAKFIVDANICKNDILSRGKSVVIVGGSGLYIDALFYGYQLPETAPNNENLESLELDELRNIITTRNLPMPVNFRNKRHLIGVIRRDGEVGASHEPEAGSLIIGLNPGRDLIKQKIHQRINSMFDRGFVLEVKNIIERFGEPPKAFDAIGYRIISRHLKGELTLEEAKELFEIGDRQYAKRQMTWFKRNPYIVWFSDSNAAKTYILEGTH